MERPPRNSPKGGHAEKPTPASLRQLYRTALDGALNPFEEARITVQRAVTRTSLSWKIVGATILAVPAVLAALTMIANGHSVLRSLAASVLLYFFIVVAFFALMWASIGFLNAGRHIWTPVPRKTLLLLIPVYALAFLFATFAVNRFLVPLLTP